MKIVLRILHFLILYLHLITKYLNKKSSSMKQSVRYMMLTLCYFTDERMLRVYTRRMTKELTHASVVVNKPTGSRLEYIRLGEVLAHLIVAGADFISIHDTSKSLHFNKKNVEMLLRRNLGTDYLMKNKGSFVVNESK